MNNNQKLGSIILFWFIGYTIVAGFTYACESLSIDTKVTVAYVSSVLFFLIGAVIVLRED